MIQKAVNCVSIQPREAIPSNHVRSGFTTPTQKTRTDHLIPEMIETTINRPKTSKRSSSAKPNRNQSLYAVRFTNGTWGPSTASHDHFSAVAELIELKEKYHSALKMVDAQFSTQNKEHQKVCVEQLQKATEMQCLADVLLEEFSNHLRAESSIMAELVMMARETYAKSFCIFEEEFNQMKHQLEDAEKSKDEAVQLMNEKVSEAQKNSEECIQKLEVGIKEADEKIKRKKSKYKETLLRFLEQKRNLEETVKGLHKIFKSLQSDSVYVTLENLKHKVQVSELRANKKEVELEKANDFALKLSEENNLLIISQTNLLKENDELKQKVQVLSTQETTVTPTPSISSFEEGEKPDNRMKIPLLNTLRQLDSVSQKLTLLMPQIEKKFQKIISHVSIDSSLYDIAKEIEQKTNEILFVATTFSQSDSQISPIVQVVNRPRILIYLSTELFKPEINHPPSFSLIEKIRDIYKMKYSEDRWYERINLKFVRFPEFVMNYFTKGSDNYVAIQQKVLLFFKEICSHSNAETELFLKFLLEDYTVDELAFFLDCRNKLLRFVGNLDQIEVFVTEKTTFEFLHLILGRFHHSLKPITTQVNKLLVDKKIEFNAFLSVLLNFFQIERKKRRNIIRIMLESKQISKEPVSFDIFLAVVNGLGYNGKQQVIYELFREALSISNNFVTLESVLQAMDNLNFHFYSIHLPLYSSRGDVPSPLTRDVLRKRWLQFGVWFHNIQSANDNFPIWIYQKLLEKVKDVDHLFSRKQSSANEMYSTYRHFLDFFQFFLFSVSDALPPELAERDLALLENDVDCFLASKILKQ